MIDYVKELKLKKISHENAVASKTYENISPHCEAGHKNIETRAYIYVTTCKAL
jgi:hypothetical protein